ncbi:DUF1501 domain-containing protein [Thalassoroseus pseudoceratinae]|uniref:DUF1501 domain-containing protein n=1 Tax=Thalassoroseus pseudoceratinae TaxID=2713176 RepID=UPI00141F1B30|nr:DUF1501 domain-containing protein [Thalassoroseus pseudoceratinae]
MSQSTNFDSLSLNHLDRRGFLSQCGLGVTGLALSSLLAREGLANSDSPQSLGEPHFPPKVKRVIWLFMIGGTSHMESFDPKPELNKHAGKTFDESPHGKAITESPFYRKNVRDFAGVPRDLMPKIYPMQVGYRKRGESGIEVSDWWEHLGDCVDDLAIVRSMWTTDNDHAAQLQFHTGRHIFDGLRPSIGAWVHHALGSLNDNLPQFIALGPPPGDCCGGVGSHGADYLGPEHAGVKLQIDPKNPLPFGTPGSDIYLEERRQQLDLLRKLNRQTALEHPEDSSLRARVKSYELAARMQLAVPEVMKLQQETQSTERLYGIDQPTTKSFGQMCLTARRLVERGVRFVQLYHDGWDAHSKLKSNHSTRIKQVDRPIAGLLQDLKQRGLLDETLVVWGTEFGRTPGAERSDGRDHHPYGFSVWLAGGGIKRGVVHGKTDELGFHATENRHYVTDLHATVLHQLGLDSRRLEVPGHKRLEIDYGKPIDEIMS